MTLILQTPLQRELARRIIDTLNLQNLAPEDIAPQQPLFGEGLGLDSVDALELALMLQQHYGIRMASEGTDARTHFASVASLADYVASHVSEPA